jgi:hypothetical protein
MAWVRRWALDTHAVVGEVDRDPLIHGLCAPVGSYAVLWDRGSYVVLWDRCWRKDNEGDRGWKSVPRSEVHEALRELGA